MYLPSVGFILKASIGGLLAKCCGRFFKVKVVKFGSVELYVMISGVRFSGVFLRCLIKLNLLRCRIE